jgi:hypoxanthine phosphoribosyltransferase
VPVEVLIDQAKIARRVTELGREIRTDAGAGVDVHLVAALKGAFVFLADLIRAIDGPASCDFIGLSTYGSGTRPSGALRITKDLETDLAGRYVVIVEDIVDTGRTLAEIQKMLRDRRPTTVKTVCLLDKPSRREVAVPVDYTGFTIDDRFVVGYGLDFNERHRNLPYVGVIEVG